VTTVAATVAADVETVEAAVAAGAVAADVEAAVAADVPVPMDHVASVQAYQRATAVDFQYLEPEPVPVVDIPEVV
jgi:hypothetical protein